jgi:hypothetical protein
MGLEDFSTESSSSSSTTGARSGTEKSEEDNKPFKTVSSSDGLQKVFPTEDSWEKTMEIVKEEVGCTEWELMNMESRKRHQVLHNAILKKNGQEGAEYSPVKHCLVCGEKFVFPSEWDFVRFKNEAVCPDHKIKDVMEEISAVNATDTNKWD